MHPREGVMAWNGSRSLPLAARIRCAPQYFRPTWPYSCRKMSNFATSGTDIGYLETRYNVQWPLYSKLQVRRALS
eukprot:2348133-Rhodomonas_salina.1